MRYGYRNVIETSFLHSDRNFYCELPDPLNTIKGASFNKVQVLEFLPPSSTRQMLVVAVQNPSYSRNHSNKAPAFPPSLF